MYFPFFNPIEIEMSNRSHWVMDYETMTNTFIACFEHYKKDIRFEFVVSPLRNDYEAFIKFLEDSITNKEYHISYNGLSFDAQVTHWILDHKLEFSKMAAPDIAKAIHGYAQYVIDKSRKGEFHDYSPWKMSIKQIDIFKMNHWDNPAKSSSLKWIQYSMDWYNVEEMPIHHNTPVTTQADLDMVISYCWNDVKSTKNIFHLSKEQVLLRKSLSEEYDIDLLSASEPRISKELFAHFLTKKLNISKKDLKEKRTYRQHIVLNECILPYIQFKTPEFNQLLEFMRSKVIVETKGALDYCVKYKGVDTYYGLGGVHGARQSGIYEATPGYTIMTSDVTSFYPNLAIRNGFAPEHLDKQGFLDLYEWFFEERKKIPKKDPKNYVYKIILNSTYGLSNDKNSFLYDPKMTMQITINGQLQLSMLYEMLAEGIPGAIPLMQNTDGLEMIIPEVYKDKYMKICEEWEKICNLQLEHDEYSKMIIGDVNNYIAISKSGNVKSKGRFEWEDLAKKKAAVLHKNKSFLVIPKAIYHYFVHGVKPEDYLAGNQNIFDYCGGAKAKGDWKFEARYLEHGELQSDPLQKMIRYYISPKGCKIMKVNQKDGREIQVESGLWRQTICNKMDPSAPFQSYDIDMSYYLEAIYKEINNIDKTSKREFAQLDLFNS